MARKFIIRCVVIIATGLSVLCLVQLALINARDKQISTLLQENASLKASIGTTEQKIAHLTAVQSDINVLQQKIQAWFSNIDKSSFAKFSHLINTHLRVSKNSRFTLIHEPSSSLDFRLAKLELSAQHTHYDTSLLLNKTLLIKNFITEIPSITPTQGFISSHFGMRLNPITHKIGPHKGTDIAGPLGTPVYASADGVVITAKHSTSFGWLIEIKHKHGFVSRYAHLHQLKVKKGQRIAQGYAIGSIGSSGHSRGPHLHYEISKNNVNLNPINFMVVSSAQSNFF